LHAQQQIVSARIGAESRAVGNGGGRCDQRVYVTPVVVACGRDGYRGARQALRLLRVGPAERERKGAGRARSARDDVIPYTEHALLRDGGERCGGDGCGLPEQVAEYPDG